MISGFPSYSSRSRVPFRFSINSISTYTSLLLLDGTSLHQHQAALILQSSSKSLPSPATTKSIHALLITKPSNQSIFLYNNLISAYAAAGDVSSARQVFDKMPQRNTVSYNSMISVYSRYGQTQEVRRIFSQMISSGLKPSQFTFGCALRSSALVWGIYLHPVILKSGLISSDPFAGTALLGVFVKHGCLDDAIKLFFEMPQQNVVTWNSIIAAFSQRGLIEDSMVLFRELLRTEISISEYTFVSILSGLRSLEDFDFGVQIHGLAIKTGTNFYTVVGNTFIDMYSRCCEVCVAEKIFREMFIRDVVSWNTIIAAFANSERPEKSLDLFMEMGAHDLDPNQASFASAISSCTTLNVLNYGKIFHTITIKKNFSSDMIVGSALVDFYIKCSKIEDGHCLFDEIDHKNIVTWNSLILGYSTRGSPYSVYLFKKMLSSTFRPDEFSFSAVLKSLYILELHQIHSLVIKMGYDKNDFVSSSIISSYADNGFFSEALSIAPATMQQPSGVQSNIIATIYNRIGRYPEALELLSQLKERDIISWNCSIEACVRNGDYKEAFQLFKHMRTTQILPDNCTFVSLLSVPSKIFNLALGSSLHGLMIKMDFGYCDVFVQNVLVDMYVKCGNLESSVKVFNKMDERNIISWTALISGLGLHGFPREALKRFKEMELLRFKPDKVSLIAILSACRHGGLVEEGIKLFESMKGVYGIEPEMDHYGCVVDMLCRDGRVKEAEQVICCMPFRPNALIWRTFLEGCKRYSKVKGYKPEEDSSIC